MLSSAVFGFDELQEAATRFRIAEPEILVGKLEQLIRSKEIAGRPKDHEFLRAFTAWAEDEEQS